MDGLNASGQPEGPAGLTPAQVEAIARAEALRGWYAKYPRLVENARALDRLRRRFHASGEALWATITGPTRSGKSQFVLDYVEAHPPVVVDGKPVQEVLYVKAPYPCTMKNLAEAIAKALGHPRPGRDRHFDVLDKAFGWAAALGNKLLFIDEAHQMIDQKTDRVVHDAALFIKDVVNKGKMCIVLVGTERVLRIIEALDELEGRGGGCLEIPAFDWYDDDARSDFITMLDDMEKELDFPRPSGLAEHHAMRIHVASKGLVGNMARLLEFAAVEAITAGSDHIRLEHLAAAHELLQVRKGRRNPFVGNAPKPVQPQPAAPDAPIAKGPGGVHGATLLT